MSRVELAENDRAGTLVELDDLKAATLAALSIVEVRPERPGVWRLLPVANTVGAVRVGDLDLVVRPKASFSSVLFMLGYAKDPGFVLGEIAGLADEGLWPAVAETLARLAERALGRGVLQGYVTREDSLAVVRGRIRMTDQIARRPGILVPLDVTYDEYQGDIAENRILRSALVRMTQVPRLPLGLHRRLGHLAARLDGVRVLVPGAPLPEWRPSRLNERYQPVLRLSELVLRHVGLSTNAGDASVAAFVVNMATVFEDFVTVALREALAHLNPGGHTESQFRTFLDTARRVPIRPDVVHTIDRIPVIVLDAKYKLGTADGRYPEADLYQVHAYCTALGLRRGWLVYAGSRAEGAAPSRHRIRNTEIDIVQWPLDVSRKPSELLRDVEQLASLALRGV
ncbi:MAG: restriction endonuclease [Cellulomonas sp. 73-92]|uniref:McrC family protein n=1 Tax=Cellulomonas sp. 73-92 TaxID=1895740 RepID=UPI00092AAC9B|nr:restriction endonuclease [Cellulomonas sp. 73-92]OJV83562.1 MAG: restriction endonuclease [Cellulomonas sp. 73-92]